MTVVFGCFLTTADAWIIEAQRGKNAGGRNRCPERIPRLPRAALVRCDVLAENRNRRAAHGPHKIAWRPQVTLALADPPERRDSREFLLHAPRRDAFEAVHQLGRPQISAWRQGQKPLPSARGACHDQSASSWPGLPRP